MTESDRGSLGRRPRTKKEWQAWRRRYALGFLSGQIDRVTNSETKKKKIGALFTEWEKRFRAECALEKPEEAVGNKHNLIEDQIDFIAQYIACAILYGTRKDNLDRIRHFLSMQGAQNHGNRMELRFLGGSPIEAFAYLDNLDDIHVADVLFITNCMHILTYRGEMQPWTEATAKRYVSKLRKDVLTDMPNTVISIGQIEEIGVSALEISVELNEDDINMQMVRYSPRL